MSPTENLYRPSITRRAIVLRGLTIFAPLAIAAAAVLLGVYLMRVRNETRIVRVEEMNRVAAQSEIIVSDFQAVAGDLMILAGGRTLARMLVDGTLQTRDAVTEEYLLFAQQRALYDQLRYVDVAGQEIIRVNYRGEKARAVPEAELQSKSNRYYHIATNQLPEGAIFVSPLDLNVERGQIERPAKPVIRFATPVFDERGDRRGMVILNYLGAVLLDKLRRAAATVPGEMMLINSDGYWLLGRTPEEEWGFMFPDRKERTFGHAFPDAWQTVSTLSQGQLLTTSGLFTFTTVDPHVRTLAQRRADDLNRRSASARDAWKVVSYVPRRELEARARDLVPLLVGIQIGLSFVLGVLCWWLARSSLLHQADRARVLQSERLAAIGEAMAGLAHESRNALQRSQAGLEMLARRVGDRPESLAIVDEVQSAHEHLRDLYEEVQSYAAPLQLNPETVDLRALIEEVWLHLAGEREGSAIEFVAVPSECDPSCMVDRRAIGQVVRNILENAIAACKPRGKIAVAISPAVIDGRPAIDVAIRDSGPGLSTEQRRHLFDAFFTTKEHGTGLGLAIAKRIVDGHGGTISAGDIGPGAVIRMTLPRGSR